MKWLSVFLLLIPISAPAQIAFKSEHHISGVGTSATLSFTGADVIPPNDEFAVQVWVDANTTITGPGPSFWDTFSQGTGTSNAWTVGIAPAITGTLTWTFGGTVNYVLVITIYGGVDRNTPFEHFTVNPQISSSVTSAVAIGVNTDFDNEVLVALYGANTAETWTTPAGMTVRYSLFQGSNIGVFSSDILVASPSSIVNYVAGMSDVGGYNADLAALVPIQPTPTDTPVDTSTPGDTPTATPTDTSTATPTFDMIDIHSCCDSATGCKCHHPIGHVCPTPGETAVPNAACSSVNCGPPTPVPTDVCIQCPDPFTPQCFMGGRGPFVGCTPMPGNVCIPASPGVHQCVTPTPTPGV